jgi:hypothetical protein
MHRITARVQKLKQVNYTYLNRKLPKITVPHLSLPRAHFLRVRRSSDTYRLHTKHKLGWSFIHASFLQRKFA